jgi:hypothetical protein
LLSTRPLTDILRLQPQSLNQQTKKLTKETDSKPNIFFFSLDAVNKLLSRDTLGKYTNVSGPHLKLFTLSGQNFKYLNTRMKCKTVLGERGTGTTQPQLKYRMR